MLFQSKGKQVLTEFVPCSIMFIHSRKILLSVIFPQRHLRRERSLAGSAGIPVILICGVFRVSLMERSRMSFSTILSAAVDGLQAELIRVEADVSNGLPVFHMVGYLSSEVREAGERVRTAIRNSGYEYPPKRTVINLSPATLRKRGASFDLPIAVAILAALGQIPPGTSKDCLIIGELGLNGSVEKVPGILPMVMEAARCGVRRCIIPGENAAEGRLVGNVEIIGVSSLKEAAACLCGKPYEKKKEIRGRGAEDDKETAEEKGRGVRIPDFAELQGQENVRRAAEIAVAGGHNLLMIGPPGSGKSLTARCMAGILPPLDEEESLEITRIYSVLGMIDPELPLISRRPFREVHQTITRAALMGGGGVPHPGEISLAHGGILFLDELPEFSRSVLEVLRQPLENREIRISRTCGTYCFPADFILVAAMNPCPCGNYPDMSKCRCTPSKIQLYMGRISRPLLDRIDLCVEAPRIGFRSLAEPVRGECSADIRKRVIRVREIQKERYKGKNIRSNAALGTEELERYCVLGSGEIKMMERAFSLMDLTARGYHRLLRTARTIADLDGEERIRENHLREALGLRMVDEKYWRR